MFTRLIFRKPFQVGRAAMAYLLSAQEPVKKYDVERRTRRTRSKALSIFLCGFSGFCVVRDFFTRSEAFALQCSRIARRGGPASPKRDSANAGLPRRSAIARTRACLAKAR